MLAEVRALRCDGQRLPRERVGGTVPQRGKLTVLKRHDPWRGCWLPFASLVGDDGQTYLLPARSGVYRSMGRR
jgi:hypothetical protein